MLAKELAFDSTEHAKVHPLKAKLPSLSEDECRERLSRMLTISSLVLDGWHFHKVLTIRASAASILELLLSKCLKKIYIHKIPHLAPGESFVTLDVAEHEVEIYNI